MSRFEMGLGILRVVFRKDSDGCPAADNREISGQFRVYHLDIINTKPHH